MNTKPYPDGSPLGEQPDTLSDARHSIHDTVNDPVTNLLLDSSHLTLPQLETLLADSVSHEKAIKKDQRRLFRPSEKKISRGSYNRSLIQAQNNVIRSIYTVLLLGYVGLFDTSALQPFIELSDTLQGYIQENQPSSSADLKAIQDLKRRLSEVISALADRQSFKDLL
ncbi:MAG: hypothetical protein ACLP5V_14815 [Candidatus Bathyarchaeia archaeon]